MTNVRPRQCVSITTESTGIREWIRLIGEKELKV